MKSKIKLMQLGLIVIIMLGVLAPASAFVGAAFPQLNSEFSQMSNDLSFEDGQLALLDFDHLIRPLVNWNS